MKLILFKIPWLEHPTQRSKALSPELQVMVALNYMPFGISMAALVDGIKERERGDDCEAKKVQRKGQSVGGILLNRHKKEVQVF